MQSKKEGKKIKKKKKEVGEPPTPKDGFKQPILCFLVCLFVCFLIFFL
jgi:hypothetical protein